MITKFPKTFPEDEMDLRMKEWELFGCQITDSRDNSVPGVYVISDWGKLRGVLRAEYYLNMRGYWVDVSVKGHIPIKREECQEFVDSYEIPEDSK